MMNIMVHMFLVNWPLNFGKVMRLNTVVTQVAYMTLAVANRLQVEKIR